MLGGFNDLTGLVEKIAAEEEARLIEIRRDIHAHPETAFEEVRTSATVARELAGPALSGRLPVGGRGRRC